MDKVANLVNAFYAILTLFWGILGDGWFHRSKMRITAQIRMGVTTTRMAKVMSDMEEGYDEGRER
jgi:hypothetical protein